MILASTKLIELYCYFLVLRVWFQLVHIDYYHIFSQILIKITEPVVSIVRKFLSFSKKYDIATISVLFLLNIIKVYLLFRYIEKSSLYIYDNLLILTIVFGLVSLCKQICFILFWLCIARAIMSWFQQQSMLNYILMKMTEPVLSKIRNILPNTGMIDFSVTIVLIIIVTVNNIIMLNLPDNLSTIWWYI